MSAPRPRAGGTRDTGRAPGRDTGRLTDADRRFMRLALALAERGRGRTRPNPMVGAVVVAGGQVIARGYHHRAGEAHAEVDALRKVGLRAPGATLYVTLEPCCHQGRTGPCTSAVLEAGIRRVVVGCRDQNPLVSGRGVTRLRRAGVEVDVGCLEDECFALNRGFFRWIRDGRPWVTLKAAATLDGYIAGPPTRRRPGIEWITNETSRRRAHELRALADAILVGAGTVRADDPLLTVRLPGARPPGPLRIVLDGRLKAPPRARLFTDRAAGSPPLVVAGDPEALPRAEQGPFARRRAALERAGAEILLLPAGADAAVGIADLLAALGKRGLQSLIVEGGSRVHGAFVAARAVDEVTLFLAPRLVGGGLPIAAGADLPIARGLHLGPLRTEPLDGDILLTASAVAER